MKFLYRLFFLLAFLPGAAHAASAEGAFTVTDVVSRALTASDAAMAAKAHLAAAAAGHKSAKADFLPRLDAAYGIQHFTEDPVAKAGGGQRQIAHETTHKWSVSMTQPVFTGFALSAKKEIAKLNSDIRRQESARTRQAVIRDAKKAAYAVLLTEKLRTVAKADVNALRAHAGDSQKFYKEGLIPLNDFLKSEVALADATQKEERAKADLRLAKTRLALLLNLPDPDGIRIQDPDQASPSLSDYNVLVEMALATRPELAANRMGLGQLQQSETIAKSGFYPKVNFVAAYEETGEDPGVDHNDYSNRFNSKVGIQASWNLFSWGKTRSQTEEARQNRLAQNAKIRQVEDAIRLEVRKAYLDFSVAGSNIKTAEEALSQARENWRITQLQYHQQVATSTDVLDARVFLTQADTNYFRALYGHLSALAELEFAVGDEKTASNG